MIVYLPAPECEGANRAGPVGRSQVKDRVDRAALAPKPARAIPIWLGGSGEKALGLGPDSVDGYIDYLGSVAEVLRLS